MSNYDIFTVNTRMPKKVKLAEISIRDGIQHEEVWIPTAAKIYYLQELAFAGVRRLEVTNLGNPRGMPQFKDAEEVLKGVHEEIFTKRLAKRNLKREDIEWTAVTIREPAVDRAIELKKKGYGPDRVLMMVSTDEEHHFANSGTTLPAYWKEAERCIKKCKDVGIKMNGTVSTIWGSPISGPTQLEDAVEFILSLPIKMQAKIQRTIGLLREFGYLLPEPHSKKIQGIEDLYELRVKLGSNICRLFYFYWKERIYVSTSGYVKKSKKTDKNQISRAVKLMKQFKEE